MYTRKVLAVLTVMLLVLAIGGPQALAGMDKKMDKKMSYYHSSSDLVGLPVKDEDGTKFGEVQDVIINDNGRVQYLLVSRESTDRLTPIPFQASTVDVEGNAVILENFNIDKLNSAPSFAKDELDWESIDQPTFDNDVHSYYGLNPPAASER